MRLPFSSRSKAQEAADSSRRSSVSEDTTLQEEGQIADDVSDRSSGTNTTPLYTPATSNSSTSTAPKAADREGKKMGMYKLSGEFILRTRLIGVVVDTSGTFLPVYPRLVKFEY